MQKQLGRPLVRYSNLLKLSLRNVITLRLQNLLTLITMSVGAFTLSATLFIGDGAMYSLWHDLETLMGSWMLVHPEVGSSTPPSKRAQQQTFSNLELDTLQQTVTTAKYVEPLYAGRLLFEYKGMKKLVSIDGITAPLLDEDIYRPLTGRKFSAHAMDGFSWECYITQSLHMEMGLPELDDLFIRVGSSNYRVAAVTSNPPEADEQFNQRVIVPYRLAEMQYGDQGHYKCLVVGWDGERAEETLQEVRGSLDQLRGPGTYYLSSSMFKLKKRKDIVKSFVVFGKTQAMFSILVASIGILNVMLANVVHKMREFAIRITLGASRREIFFIVISESVCYAVLGSALGIGLSVWLSPDICSLVGHYLQDTKNLAPYISLQSILIPLVICSACGLIAGITPAFRAIRVDILSILRAE